MFSKNHADTIRKGRVSSINYGKGLMRVVYAEKDNCVTKEIPMINNGEYNMPSVGDLVLVTHLSNSPESAVVLGTYFSDPSAPEDSGASVYAKKMGEGCKLVNDGGETVLSSEKTIKVTGATGVEVSSDGTVLIKGANVSIEGVVNIVGSLTVNGRAVMLE